LREDDFVVSQLPLTWLYALKLYKYLGLERAMKTHKKMASEPGDSM